MVINCPSALALVAAIEQNTLDVNTLFKEMSGADQGRSYLKSIGIDIDHCDPLQIMQVCRHRMNALSDEDLSKAAGGEVKFAVLVTGVVGTFAAATVTGGVLAATVGKS